MYTPRSITTRLLILLFIVGLSFVVRVEDRQARALEMPYPRTANYFLDSYLYPGEAAELAQWDVLVLSPPAQDFKPEVFEIMREINPDIIILAYISGTGVSMHPIDEKFTSLQPLSEPNIPHAWDLVSSTGEKVNYWPSGRMLNPTNIAPEVNGQRWNEWIAQFVAEDIYGTGYWDGVFIDEAFDSVTWLNGADLDFDRDGVAEAREDINRLWHEGVSSFFEDLRARMGSNAIIMLNGSSRYTQHTNGRMHENVFKPSDGPHDWESDMKSIVSTLNTSAYQPQLSIINANTGNTGFINQPQAQFALGSTLLTDAFFSYDHGDQRHMSMWWLDPYSIDLGYPRARAYNIYNDALTMFVPDIWVREFDNGVVVVNASNDTFNYSVLVNGSPEERSLPVQRADIIEQGSRIRALDGLLPAPVVAPTPTPSPEPAIEEVKESEPAPIFQTPTPEVIPEIIEEVAIQEVLSTEQDEYGVVATQTREILEESNIADETKSAVVHKDSLFDLILGRFVAALEWLFTLVR